MLVSRLPAQLYTCEPLDDPHTMVIELSPGDDIRSILYSANSGTTYLLNTGTYHVTDIIQILAEDVTIRSASKNRNDVILDGNAGGQQLSRSNFASEILQIRASRVTVADLTIRYAQDHGLHLMPPPNGTTIKDIRLHNIRVYDCGEQLIKANSNGNPSNLQWVDSSILECSLIEFVDNSVMQPQGGGFYTGGLDVHGGRGWIIRGCTFRGIENQGKSMEHAIHLWSRSRETLIENSYFENCWRAVGLGMKRDSSGFARTYSDAAGATPYFDHIGGIVRNNVVYNQSGIHLETGIEIMNVKDAEVYHNTVISEDQPFNSMEYRWPNTTVTIKNNLCTHRIMKRDNASGNLAANITNASTNLFANIAGRDFHLKNGSSTAIDRGVTLPGNKSGVDIDGVARGANPDIGADETNSVAVAPPARPRTGLRNHLIQAGYDLRGKRVLDLDATRLRRRANGFSGILFLVYDNASAGLIIR
ncbi:MAG: hypothetical protein GF398_03950 [Chitinivibrionales bacterium]|nr:hypothetical protein [Chitinivibrionales bacterium]